MGPVLHCAARVRHDVQVSIARVGHYEVVEDAALFVRVHCELRAVRREATHVRHCETLWSKGEEENVYMFEYKEKYDGTIRSNLEMAIGVATCRYSLIRVFY